MSSNRLLIVSNRLPVTARITGGRVQLTTADGGLATGLERWHRDSNGVWIGWPGDVSACTAEQRVALDQQLGARGIAPVHLSRDHVDRFYHGFSNRVLWPLFHYLIDRVPVGAGDWNAYREANEAFADAVVREHRPGDLIWVHDYQLMLLPALLRDRLPDARIGFFLHIPFPSSEVFRILPWRREILAGLLGADLLGFHTFSYMRHFVASLLHVDGVEVDIDRVVVGDRDVRLGVFPMGIDASRFADLSNTPEVAAEAAAIRRDAGGRRIVLGVDRLDYTKGIPRRLQAVERLLARQPELADRIRYVQLAVPSRGEVDSYQRFRRQVEEIVGHINGTYGTVRSTPVHYMHRAVSTEQLVALYRAADVMLVTPLRDGMNLVAKEFIASRVDEDGVLILSEFAGASAELADAVVVNPYDVDAVADSLHRALTMSGPECRARMKSLRRRVMEHDVHAWARTFIGTLEETRPAAPRSIAAPEPSVLTVLAEARRTASIRLMLGYDGTLVPFARAPELAAPDGELMALIGQLAASPGIEIDIVSGRARETLESWFGGLRLSLWAEHGFWHRAPGATRWDGAAHVSREWIARVRPILEQFTSSTPGSLIEEKTASIAWHYRGVQREFGARQAHELRMLLGDALSNQPLEVLEGKKVIEVRLRGVSKGLVSRRVVNDTAPGVQIIAVGDDCTDEDLFAALPASAVTIAVGQRPSRARYHFADYHAVRRALDLLLDSAGSADPHTVAGAAG
jgi:trehalose 6-phosphate synthase/phosphatase